MEVFEAFSADMRAGPQWVYWWVNFMGVIIMLAIPFSITRVEARWTLFAMILNVIFMMWLYSQVGYVRLLGLPHVVLWTPLAFYLWQRRDRWQVRTTLGGKWIVALFTIMVISLVMDYADVVRYLLGDHG